MKDKMQITDNIKMINAILKDAKASSKYLDETGDRTSARGRRCVQIVDNVAWLLAKEGKAWAQNGLLVEPLGNLHNLEEPI